MKVRLTNYEPADGLISLVPPECSSPVPYLQNSVFLGQRTVLYSIMSPTLAQLAFLFQECSGHSEHLTYTECGGKALLCGTSDTADPLWA